MQVAGSALTFSREPLGEAMDALRRLGFERVELAALQGWAHIDPSRLADDPEAQTAAVRLALAGAGVRAVALNAGLGDAAAAERQRRAQALFRLAAACGIPVVTLPAGPAGGGAAAAAADLRPMVGAAARHGVTLAVETHIGSVTQDPAAAAALCRAVPGLRLTLDPSHYWAGPAQGLGWEAAVPYVAHVHLRDAGLGGWPEIQVWPGLGAVDFAAVCGALRAAGYVGAHAVEYIDTLPVSGGGTAPEAAVEMARRAEAWGA